MFYVRTASVEDLPVIRDILVETWHATYDPIYGPEKVGEITADWHSLAQLEENLRAPNSEFIVADNGEVVGGMAYAVQSGKTILLRQLYVHPRYHGGKTGLHLLIEIENSFMDCNEIRLEVEEKNERAVAFYKKYGFEIAGSTKNCGREGSGIPALIMQKEIIYAQD